MKPFFTFVLLIMLIGCGESENPPVVGVESGDSEMNSAIAKAQETLEHFFANYQSMPNDGYSLKFRMPTPDGEGEHIWFNPVEVSGDTVTAQCANEPMQIPDLKAGDTRVLSKSDITDWMIIAGSKCYGGYTIRVLAKRDSANAPPFEFADF